MHDDSCPADPLLKFLAQEWTPHIVYALARHGTMRFGALRRTLPPGASARILSARLKDLAGAGYVQRRDRSDRVRHVEYSLTSSGLELDRMLRGSEAVMPARAATATTA